MSDPVNRPGPPARLTRAQAQARTRDALVAAAAEAFAERGFHGTSVEDVVTRAGFTRGAFYSNFTGKDDLFLAVLDAQDEADVAGIGPLVETARSLEDLLALLRQHRRANPVDASWRLLLAEFRLHALRDPEIRPRLAQRERAQREAYGRAIRYLFDAADITPPADVELLALIVQVLDDGVALHRDVDPEAIPPQAFLSALHLLFEATAALADRQGRPEQG